MNAERPLLMMDPNKELEFEYIQGTTVTSALGLKNAHNLPVAFKVRTTAPKAYLVRPNQGILLPGEAKELSIIMQPLSEHPGEVSHRFLVQATPTQLNPNTSSSQDLSDLWSSAKEGAQSTKLSVRITEKNQRTFQPRPTVYMDPVEPQPRQSIDKFEEIKKQIRDLTSFNSKLEETHNELDGKLKKINDEQKRREFDPKKVTESTGKGFGLFHVMMCLVAGIIIGYLSSVNRS